MMSAIFGPDGSRGGRIRKRRSRNVNHIQGQLPLVYASAIPGRAHPLPPATGPNPEGSTPLHPPRLVGRVLQNKKSERGKTCACLGLIHLITPCPPRPSQSRPNTRPRNPVREPSRSALWPPVRGILRGRASLCRGESSGPVAGHNLIEMMVPCLGRWPGLPGCLERRGGKHFVVSLADSMGWLDM